MGAGRTPIERRSQEFVKVESSGFFEFSLGLYNRIMRCTLSLHSLYVAAVKGLVWV